MKKTLIIIFSILLLIFLLINGIRMQTGKVDNEKEWYVSQLHYEFNGSIDSIRMFNQHLGRIQFHFTRDSIDRTVEEKLNKKLKHNGNLVFLLRRSDANLRIISRQADQCSPGDSLYVNTDKNQILVYRKGKKVSETTVTASLNGRPF